MITWRDATKDDLPEIERLWAEQEARFSDTQSRVDRPKLFCDSDDPSRPFFPFQPPVIHVRVGERDGRAVAFRYTECVPEVCIVTGDEEVMKSLGSELTQEAQWAKMQGFRSGWGLVPTKFANSMSRFLRNYPHIRPWKSLTPVGIDFQELGD